MWEWIHNHTFKRYLRIVTFYLDQRKGGELIIIALAILGRITSTLIAMVAVVVIVNRFGLPFTSLPSAGIWQARVDVAWEGLVELSVNT